MKKVTLLGDSIRLMGYGKLVPDDLKDEFEVLQFEDNGRFALYTLRNLFDFKGTMEGTDIVHWNNGLWDICELFDDGQPFVTKEAYVETMLHIAKILLSRYKKVIFATTTPVSPKNVYDRNEVIDEFNAAIVPELEKLGVMINDLNSLVKADIDKYICEDTIHLSDEGARLCANAVEKCIREAAATL